MLEILSNYYQNNYILAKVLGIATQEDLLKHKEILVQNTKQTSKSEDYIKANQIFIKQITLALTYQLDTNLLNTFLTKLILLRPYLHDKCNARDLDITLPAKQLIQIAKSSKFRKHSTTQAITSEVDNNPF